MSQANPNEITLDAIREVVQEVLEPIRKDIKDIKTDISRIDGNIRVLATQLGFVYNDDTKEVPGFERKVG